jgi:hypothetical protein
MKEYTAKAYRFSELSEKAQQNVIHRWQEDGYHLADEAINTLKKMAEAFGGKLTNWSIDFFGGDYSETEFDMPDYEREEIGAVFDKLDIGSCPLTGYFFDIDALEAAKKAFDEDVYSLTEIMQIGADALIKSAQEDCEASFSVEVMSDNCDANDYWFDDTGRRLRNELVEA